MGHKVAGLQLVGLKHTQYIVQWYRGFQDHVKNLKKVESDFYKYCTRAVAVDSGKTSICYGLWLII